MYDGPLYQLFKQNYGVKKIKKNFIYGHDQLSMKNLEEEH
jgi:hypothetical protein